MPESSFTIDCEYLITKTRLPRWKLALSCGFDWRMHPACADFSYLNSWPALWISISRHALRLSREPSTAKSGDACVVLCLVMCSTSCNFQHAFFWFVLIRIMRRTVRTECSTYPLAWCISGVTKCMSQPMSLSQLVKAVDSNIRLR